MYVGCAVVTTSWVSGEALQAMPSPPRQQQAQAQQQQQVQAPSQGLSRGSRRMRLAGRTLLGSCACVGLIWSCSTATAAFRLPPQMRLPPERQARYLAVSSRRVSPAVAFPCHTRHSAALRASPLAQEGAEAPAAAHASHVVICGGGIQGAATSYYLSLRGVTSTVVERCEVAGAASGKAGGFLARNWGAGPTEQLHKISFDLHEQLAEDLALQGYRKLPALAVTPGARQPLALAGQGMLPAWLDGQIAAASLLDDPGLVKRSMGKWETAQTSPFELTTRLLAAAGSHVIQGTVEGVELEGNAQVGTKVTGVVVDGEVLEADAVVVAMGPWSCLAEEWFDGLKVPMQGVQSTSIVFETRSDEPVEPAVALFCAEDDHGCNLEVYPRDNTIYVCGTGGSVYLDNARLKCLPPDAVLPDPQRVGAARQAFSDISSLGNTSGSVVQACIRPCPPDGLPLLGAIPGTVNAFMAAGHNCWGITWAPVTGLAISQLLVDGRCSCVDLSPFDPGRFSGNDCGRDAIQWRGRQKGSVPIGEQW